MRKTLWACIKRVAKTRVGHLLVVLSVCFVLIAFMKPSMSHPQFVDCVQSKGETLALAEVLAPKPIWVVAIGYLYLPSIVISVGLTNLFGSIFSLSCVPKTRLELVIFLVCSSIQWMLIGYGIEHLIKRWRT